MHTVRMSKVCLSCPLTRLSDERCVEPGKTHRRSGEEREGRGIQYECPKVCLSYPLTPRGGGCQMSEDRKDG